NQGAEGLGEAVQRDASVALFQFLEPISFSPVLSLLAIAMVLVFFVTSADSGALVLNMLSSHGRDDTPRLRRAYWMAVIGVSALVLMFVGGMKSLQTAAIASALPFSVALLLALWGLAKALHEDQTRRQAVLMTSLSPPSSTPDWERRLGNLLSRPTSSQVRRFQLDVVLPAMREFATALQRHGVVAHIDEDIEQQGIVTLQVPREAEHEFRYEVRESTTAGSSATTDGELVDEPSAYQRAEVHLSEGGQDYCIMGWSAEQVRLDILEQFGRHQHFLSLLRQ
ncbi:MAG: BCCT family transporter, partial [Pseudomonadota bacterium]